MRISNNDAKVLRLSRYKINRFARRTVLMISAVAFILVLGHFSGLLKLSLLPHDAGPTELTAHPRISEIQKVDFECHATVTSVFTVSAYNPGWKLFFINGGNAVTAFDVVGDLDLCIWANDYQLIDEGNGQLTVDVQRIDVRRPRLVQTPQTINGVTYETLKLSSLGETKLSDANIDRVLWEALRNAVSGNDRTYIDEHEEMLLKFGENVLAQSACYPEAIKVMRRGVYEHYMAQAELFGFDEVVVKLPYSVDVPSSVEPIDSGQTELNIIGDEECYVVEDAAL